MPTIALRLSVLALPTLAILLGGCGKPLAATVDVAGKVIFPPNIKFEDNDMTTITFLPDGETKAQGDRLR